MSPIGSIEQRSLVDTELLWTEIERYLEVVEAFRVEGYEPAFVDNEGLVRALDAMS